MGKSSTGKDTILRRLIADKELKLKLLITYTTRPVRNNEIHGRDYYFINDPELEEFIRQGKVIEIRRYNTVNGIWSYANIDDGHINMGSCNYILIGTLEAYKSLGCYYGSEMVVPIYVDCEDGLRLERALSRERTQAKPNYQEMCRRFLADCQDFSDEKLAEAGINRFYNNEDLNKCINDIKKDIFRGTY